MNVEFPFKQCPTTVSVYSLNADLPYNVSVIVCARYPTDSSRVRVRPE